MAERRRGATGLSVRAQRAAAKAKAEAEAEAEAEAKAAEEKTAIVAPLRGEAVVDEALVDEAVQHINRVYTGRALELAREVGGYVLATFFGGDPATFRERGSDHASFKELSEREDLQFSKVWLWRAVSVYEQLAVLPEDVAEALPYTHHTVLLPVKDEEKKVELAEAAVEEGWTKDQLQEEVSKVRDQEKVSKGGRKALLPFVKTLNKLERMLEDEAAFAGGLEQVDQLTEGEVERLQRTIDGLQERLASIEGALA